MLIDTHAHLYYDSFKDDFDAVIKRAKDAGLKTIINIGTDLETSKKALELENPEISFYSSIGIHPEDTINLTTSESIHEHIKKLEQLYQIHTGKIIAIGECGLDYFTGRDPEVSTPLSPEAKKLQHELFVSQIELAKKLNLPLIIHCRDAWDDIFLPELEGTTGVFHSFTGSPEIAQKVLDLGYYIGLSCPVTYPKNDYLRQIITDAPLEKLLTETDCPFLPPQTMRGHRNEPANVAEVVRVIAEVRNLSFEEAAEKTYKNAQKLFSVV